MTIFTNSEGKNPPLNDNFTTATLCYRGRPNQRPTSPWPLCDLLPLKPHKRIVELPLFPPPKQTNQQNKTPDNTAAPASINTHLKEEITPGGVHPEQGPKPHQSGSKEGREEGNGAEEETLQLLWWKQNVRPVSQLLSACLRLMTV